MQQWQVGPVPPEYLYSNSAQHATNDMHTPHTYQADMSRRTDFAGYTQPPNPAAQPHQQHPQQHHQAHGQHQQHQGHQQAHGQHQQHQGHQQQHSQHHQQPHGQQHGAQHQQHHGTPVQPPMTVAQPNAASNQQGTPTQTPTPAPSRGRKRAAPGHPHPSASTPAPAAGGGSPAVTTAAVPVPTTPAPAPTTVAPPTQVTPVVPPASVSDETNSTPTSAPPTKKSRTNTPWTPAEELRLKQMRDAGNSWAEIAKTFPTRTEGSVKKHWYKDMHYAEFAEDESQALLSAIKDYENNKWKTIGQKVGKPAKACEQYAKEHFPDLFGPAKAR